MWPAGAEHPMGMGHGTAAPAPARPSTSTHSASPAAWQSPVPYLFGGLAAMLGLIALSLLALACSYWKLSGSFMDDDDDLERQAGAGRRQPGDGKAAAAAGKAAGEHWREHVVVIMAGDERPTFLATPASSGRGAPDEDDARGVGCGGAGGGSGSVDGDEGRCVECGARSWPARAAGDELRRGEQSGVSVSGSSSVISER